MVPLQVPTIHRLSRKCYCHHQRRLPRLSACSSFIMQKEVLCWNTVIFPVTSKGHTFLGWPCIECRKTLAVYTSTYNNTEASPSEKSDTTVQPTPSNRSPAPNSKPTFPPTIVTDSSPTDSTDSVLLPKCKVLSGFQWEHCGMKLGSRKYLYEHKQRKHKMMKLRKLKGIRMSFVPSARKQKVKGMGSMHLLVVLFFKSWIKFNTNLKLKITVRHAVTT